MQVCFRFGFFLCTGRFFQQPRCDRADKETRKLSRLRTSLRAAQSLLGYRRPRVNSYMYLQAIVTLLFVMAWLVYRPPPKEVLDQLDGLSLDNPVAQNGLGLPSSHGASAALSGLTRLRSTKYVGVSYKTLQEDTADVDLWRETLDKDQTRFDAMMDSGDASYLFVQGSCFETIGETWKRTSAGLAKVS